MKRLPVPARLFNAVLLALMLVLTGPAPAQTPAELAPADTAVFVHINKPADWFTDLTQGPLGEKMLDKIEQAEGSGDLLAALGMNTNQFMQAYFGEDVVVLGKGGDNGPGVIFTKIAKADRDHAIDSLGLTRNGDIAGNPVYVGPDGDGIVVMMKDWVAMSDLKSTEYLTSILKQAPGAKRLADTERYTKWTKELPADRVMTALLFEAEDNQHALGVVRKGKGMDATYLGTSPDFKEMLGMLGETTVAEFGPLPGDTISAITFNLQLSEEDQKQFAALDPFLQGKSFTKDVLPKLDPPTLLFMSSVPGTDVDPKVEVEVPVVGMAFKMNDATVAADLTQLMDSVVMVTNLSIAQFEQGLMPQRTEAYKGASFKVAELGKPIALGLEFPELAPIQIVYGQIGDYYVICTQEQYFKKCVDANAGGKAMRMGIEGPTHRLAKTPILAMTARPDGFGQLLLSWANMLEEKGLPPAFGFQPGQTETGILFDLVQGFQQYSLFKMQVWSGEDDLVVGRFQLTPPQ